MKINLTKVEIDNYKSIKNFSFKLTSNSTNSKEDVLLGGFKEVNKGKSIIPAYSVIFGRNSIGKTSVLNAISYFASFINGQISSAAMNKVVNDEISISGSTPLISVGTNIQARAQEINKQVQKKSGEYYEKYDKVVKMIISKSFDKFSSDKEKAITIKMYFEIDNKPVSAIFTNINEKASVTYGVGATQLEKQLIFDYIGGIIISSSELSIDGVVGINSSAELNEVNINNAIATKILPGLIEILGKEKATQIIALADPSIKDINLITNKQGNKVVKNMIFEYGIGDLISLSSGTKRFINLVYRIILPKKQKSLINHGSLVLIDELEINLHKELMNSLKMLMNLMFEKYNIQYIFTTHNPYSVTDSSSNKQIFSMEIIDEKLKIVKISDLIKPHQPKLKSYDADVFASFPDKEKARNIISGLL